MRTQGIIQAIVRALATPLLERDGPVENHVQRRALAQVDFFAPAQQDGRQANAAANARADTGALPTAVRESSDRRAAAGQDGDLFGVLAVGRALLDHVLTRLHLLSGVVRIDRAQVRREFENLAAGESDGFEPNAQLRSAGYAAAAARLRDHTLHVAIGR